MNNESERIPGSREDHHLISPTAKLVAHLRAETDIPYSAEIDRICEAGPVTEELFGSKESLVWMSALLELRYKSLSGLLEKEMQEKGINQVLELACGIQPRGLIMSENPEITYIETDLDGMAQEKESLVSELNPEAANRENYKVEPLNVLDPERVAAVAAGLGEGSVAVIHEGLLPYLSVEEKAVAAKNIHALLSEKGGVWITPDISNSSRIRDIIGLFPGAAEVVGKISTATGRDLRSNNIGDKETTLQFYRDAGFAIREYTQKEFVSDVSSLELIPEETTRASVDSALSESGIWVLEVSKE